jgi:phosphoribosylformimino-5-aminoimidazole carboxamide ribotide isomerase
VILYPAIDLKDGQVVRLERGRMDKATVYDDDPAARAAAFAAAGCAWLHLVDLDGAVSGQAVNAAAVESVLRAVDVPVQLGGGIRDRAGAEAWLERGVARVILGTTAVRDPDLVRALAAEHPERIAVALDARDGRIATDGWLGDSEVAALDLARDFAESGVAALIYTDIDRDGMLGGPNVAATAALARAVPVPVIASGGIASIDDLLALQATGVISGAISGRAIYDGRIELTKALAALGAGSATAC